MPLLKLKLLEPGKTRTKNANPHIFKFYVVLAGHGKVSDAGKDTTGRPKFKAPSLQTGGIKNEWPPEDMGFKGKQFDDFRRKKKK